MKKIIKHLLLTLLFSTSIQAGKLEEIRGLLTISSGLEDGTEEQSLAAATGLEKAFELEFRVGITELEEAHLPHLYRLPEGFKKNDVELQYDRFRICYSTGSGSKMLSPVQKDRALRVNELLCDLLVTMADLDEAEDGGTAKKAGGIRIPA